MHVGCGIWGKVHYNALFGGGKRRKRGEKALTAETLRARRENLREAR
jgi:hypothetical protein